MKGTAYWKLVLAGLWWMVVFADPQVNNRMNDGIRDTTLDMQANRAADMERQRADALRSMQDLAAADLQAARTSTQDAAIRANQGRPLDTTANIPGNAGARSSVQDNLGTQHQHAMEMDQKRADALRNMQGQTAAGLDRARSSTQDGLNHMNQMNQLNQGHARDATLSGSHPTLDASLDAAFRNNVGMQSNHAAEMDRLRADALHNIHDATAAGLNAARDSMSAQEAINHQATQDAVNRARETADRAREAADRMHAQAQQTAEQVREQWNAQRAQSAAQSTGTGTATQEALKAANAGTTTYVAADAPHTTVHNPAEGRPGQPADVAGTTGAGGVIAPEAVANRARL